MKNILLTCLCFLGIVASAETYSGSCTDEFRQTAWSDICTVTTTGTYTFSFGTGAVAGSNEMAINGQRLGLECYPPGPLTGEISLTAGDRLQALCAWDSLTWVLTLTLQGAPPQCPLTPECIICTVQIQGEDCGRCTVHDIHNHNSCPHMTTCEPCIIEVSPGVNCGRCTVHDVHNHDPVCPNIVGVCDSVVCSKCSVSYCKVHKVHFCQGAGNCPYGEGCKLAFCFNCRRPYCSVHQSPHTCVPCPDSLACVKVQCQFCDKISCKTHEAHICPKSTVPPSSDPVPEGGCGGDDCVMIKCSACGMKYCAIHSPHNCTHSNKPTPTPDNSTNTKPTNNTNQPDIPDLPTPVINRNNPLTVVEGQGSSYGSGGAGAEGTGLGEITIPSLGSWDRLRAKLTPNFSAAYSTDDIVIDLTVTTTAAPFHVYFSLADSNNYAAYLLRNIRSWIRVFSIFAMIILFLINVLFIFKK